jgi:hypothetical protein
MVPVLLSGPLTESVDVPVPPVLRIVPALSIWRLFTPASDASRYWPPGSIISVVGDTLSLCHTKLPVPVWRMVP